MGISFDPLKRDRTLAERGLDFVDAKLVFAGMTATHPAREGYGAARFVTAGFLGGRMVVLVWTPRGDARHIMSMRYCHAGDERLWRERMG